MIKKEKKKQLLTSNGRCSLFRFGECCDLVTFLNYKKPVHKLFPGEMRTIVKLPWVRKRKGDRNKN